MRPTLMSKSLAEAGSRSKILYRTVLRSIPTIMVSYDLEYPASVLRARMRQEFEKNRYIKDINVIDMLVFRGGNELEETMSTWKTRSHIEKYFISAPKQEKSYLEKFFSGEIR